MPPPLSPPDLLSSPAALLRESIRPAAWVAPLARVADSAKASSKRCLVIIVVKLL
ncbi:Uncharacterised protein [Acinetobacter baumannii]|nr:Uncharacterised protein [Acinetobacter baumannii]